MASEFDSLKRFAEENPPPQEWIEKNVDVGFINLDELQVELEKLLVLLKDRQPGFTSWNIFLNEQLKYVNNMIDEVFELRERKEFDRLRKKFE